MRNDVHALILCRFNTVSLAAGASSVSLSAACGTGRPPVVSPGVCFLILDLQKSGAPQNVDQFFGLFWPI